MDFTILQRRTERRIRNLEQFDPFAGRKCFCMGRTAIHSDGHQSGRCGPNPLEANLSPLDRSYPRRNPKQRTRNTARIRDPREMLVLTRAILCQPLVCSGPERLQFCLSRPSIRAAPIPTDVQVLRLAVGRPSHVQVEDSSIHSFNLEGPNKERFPTLDGKTANSGWKIIFFS